MTSAFKIVVETTGDVIDDVGFAFDVKGKDEAVLMFVTSFVTTFENAVKYGEDRKNLITLASMMLGDLAMGVADFNTKEEKENGKTPDNLN